MNGSIRSRRLMSIATLALAWCGLWRDLSVANVLAGLVIGFVVTSTDLGTDMRGKVRPGPLLRLLWLVLLDLSKSTVSVAFEILTPTDRTHEAIIAVTVPEEGKHHLLLLTVAVTLTPGTAVVDTDRENGTLYLHLLHHRRRQETIEHVAELSRLACSALPVRSSSSSA